MILHGMLREESKQEMSNMSSCEYQYLHPLVSHIILLLQEMYRSYKIIFVRGYDFSWQYEIVEYRKIIQAITNFDVCNTAEQDSLCLFWSFALHFKCTDVVLVPISFASMRTGKNNPISNSKAPSGWLKHLHIDRLKCHLFCYFVSADLWRFRLKFHRILVNLLFIRQEYRKGVQVQEVHC